MSASEIPITTDLASQGRQRDLRTVRFRLRSGIELAADLCGAADACPVILMHGGGQTRHAWGGTAQALARDGYFAISLDLRGHGDSDWDPDGDYALESYVEDLHEIMAMLPAKPALVGASLGGMISMASQGEVSPGSAAAVVLVDIAPKMEREGIDRIVAFMTAKPDGYESLEEVADAIAAYLPHRKRPRDVSGLEKNLRKDANGRYRWHWDPNFLRRTISRRESVLRDRLDEIAARIEVPTLLVRGQRSDVLSEEGVRHFLEILPHAEFVDVEDAAHMVAGDRNDIFTEAVVEFLERTIPPVAPATPAAPA